MIRADKSARNFKTILMYFGFRNEDYWHIDYPITMNKYNGNNYFWDISKKATWFSGAKDINDIILYRGEDDKYYYNAIEIGQYALGAYEVFIKSVSERWMKEFLSHCNWLVKNQKTYKQCNGVWINKFPVRLFGLYGNWSSALGQAFGISALTRAYLETQKEQYLESARKASLSFGVSIDKGGVFSNQKDFICLEEYTTTKPSSVLNGYISAIWSIYDLMQVDDKYEELFQLHIQNLSENLKKWDIGFWSWYDLWSEHNFIASYFYHNLHIKQLKILHELTGKKIFNDYANKWQNYQKNAFFRIKALVMKIWSRIK